MINCIHYCFSFVIFNSLPKKVYFCEEPQVARWNDKDNEWSVDGFYEHNYEEGKFLTLKDDNNSFSLILLFLFIYSSNRNRGKKTNI